MLDVGVGEGRLASFLIASATQYVGVDLSLKMLRRAKENLRGKKGSLHLVLVDAENLPFKDKSFNKIVCLETTFFIPNQEKLVWEIGRTLESNGVVYCEFLNRSNLYILINDWILNRIFNVGVRITSRVNTLLKLMLYVVNKTTKREYGLKNEWISVFKDFGAPKHYPTPFSVFFKLLSENSLKVKGAVGFLGEGFLTASSPESCRRILVKAVRK